MNRSTETELMCPVRGGDGWFVIPSLQVREVLGPIDPYPVPLAPDFVAGVIPYRGEVLTAVSLRALLRLEPVPGKHFCLVLESETEEGFALMVDAIAGVISMERCSLETSPANLDAPHKALFSETYHTNFGSAIRLESRQLSPARIRELAASILSSPPLGSGHNARPDR